MRTWPSVLLDPKSQMLARMLLSQSITALEVFLADTLILTVANNKTAQGRMLKSKDLGIGIAQFNLVDAIGIENFARYKLIEHLRAVSFHNMKKVRGLFRVGLGIEILPESEVLERITNAIKMRHDCVHRNGIDRETGILHSIDKTLLLGLTDTLLQIAKLVDNKVQDLETPF